MIKTILPATIVQDECDSLNSAASETGLENFQVGVALV